MSDDRARGTLVVAIDIGGTKIAGALVDANGRTSGPVTRLPTPSDGEGVVLSVISLARYLRTDDCLGIGIASAGVIGFDGTVRGATSIIPDWMGKQLATRVEQAVGLPTIALNDVHATAVAEHAFGAARGLSNALVLAVGTGVGGALILNGQLLEGRTGTAGSIAHLTSEVRRGRPCACGGTDHVEAYASGPGIERTYFELSSRLEQLPAIAEAARQGEDTAIRAILDGARILGTSLASLVDILDPDAVIVGGGVAQVGPLYWDELQRSLRDSALPTVRDVGIEKAQLGVEAPLVGAAIILRDRLSA